MTQFDADRPTCLELQRKYTRVFLTALFEHYATLHNISCGDAVQKYKDKLEAHFPVEYLEPIKSVLIDIEWVWTDDDYKQNI